MARGYMGKMLIVDLSRNELKDEVLDEKLGRQFIGGYGIGARILFSRQKAGVDPLGPDNTFGILTGPFTGTPTLSGTRHTVVGKSPLKEGPLAGVTVDEDTLIKDCLTALDWDLKTAKPSKKKLLELGLEDVAKVLWP